MTASTYGSDRGETNDVGLVPGHAYTLLRVEQDVCGSGIDLLQLRNPWGRGEWRGDWGDGSATWRRHPRVKEYIQPDDEDDGEFWMSAADFDKYFHEVDCCFDRDTRDNFSRAASAQRSYLTQYFRVRRERAGASLSQQSEWSVNQAMKEVMAKPRTYAGFVTKGDDKVWMIRRGHEDRSHRMPGYTMYVYRGSDAATTERRPQVVEIMTGAR